MNKEGMAGRFKGVRRTINIAWEHLPDTVLFMGITAVWGIWISAWLGVPEGADDVMGILLAGGILHFVNRGSFHRLAGSPGSGSGRIASPFLHALIYAVRGKRQGKFPLLVFLIFLNVILSLNYLAHHHLNKSVMVGDVAVVLIAGFFFHGILQKGSPIRAVAGAGLPAASGCPTVQGTGSAEAAQTTLFHSEEESPVPRHGGALPSPAPRGSPAAGPDESTPPAVLLVDDDEPFLLSAALSLRTAGISPIHTLSDSRQALPFLSETNVGVVVLDLNMPHVHGKDLLLAIRESFPEVAVVVLTADSDLSTAVECMKAGASDYLVKPVEKSRFDAAVRRLLEIRELREQVTVLRSQMLEGPGTEVLFHGMVSGNRKMMAVFQYVKAFATSRQPVLITGETGVGKELVARAIHERSGRKGEFVAVNVAGLDDAMFSDDLFGHRKGAFTGAVHGREGLVARAEGGTLFLDEIGDLAEPSQVKLLRLIEGGEYYPIGSDAPRRSDARVVCATNRSLRERQATGAFRKDLFYRLAGHHVSIPPLRDRREDIPLLVGRFLEEECGKAGWKIPALPPELWTLLSVYHFPGNVRELRSMVHNAVSAHRGGVLSLEEFRRAISRVVPPSPAKEGKAVGPGVPFPIADRFPTLQEAEEFLVSEALKRSGNNQGIASLLLGITRAALNKRLVRARKDVHSLEKA